MSQITRGKENTIYARLESNVRSYCRNVDEVFVLARGAELTASSGDTYLDFMSGCGSLNYGHNHPVMKEALLDYIARDGLAMGLDFHSQAKSDFLNAFEEFILLPRGLDYVVQFPGPTGTNAVEAAIKLARKKTGRHTVVAFTNAFHGCSLGSLALTGNKSQRQSSIARLHDVFRAPYCGYLDAVDTAAVLEKLVYDPSSGLDEPAAILLEVVQGEGGLHHATKGWATKIASIAERTGAALIVDEIQTGCGRTGTFFAFEKLGLKPDIVTLAKSISGYGLPMSLTLLRREHDVWEPAEHNGTFRGNCHAFITAAATLKHFWSKPGFAHEIEKKSDFLRQRLGDIAERYGGERRGVGMMQGLAVSAKQAQLVKETCIANKIIIENCGPFDEVVKLMPPLTVTYEQLDRAIAVIETGFAQCRYLS